MNENIILNYLRDNRTYVFKVGDFILPKKLKTISGNKIDLETNRSNLLKQGSYWSPKFEKYLLSTNIEYIKEVPFIIENMRLWRFLCNKYGTNKKYVNTNYFFADYVFPYYNLIIEIDSSMHNEEYDKARNEYIHRTWGIYSLRFYEFGRIAEKDSEYLKEFGRFIQDLNRSRFLYSLSTPIQLDYSNLLIKQFNADHLSLLTPISEIESEVFRLAGNYFRTRSYSISMRNLSNETINILKDRSNLNRVESLFRSMYGINVSINP
jgi:hypothetical protein